MIQLLKAVAEDNRTTWPQRLPTVMSAYRMNVHKTTGVTPNMAMLGREVLLPATLVARLTEESHRITVPFVRDLRDALRVAHERVRVATKSSARMQKRYYDDRSKQTSFSKGQKVWLFWPRPPIRQRFRKLQKLWTGPWVIESFKAPLVVARRQRLLRRRSSSHDVTRACPCAARVADVDRSACVPLTAHTAAGIEVHDVIGMYARPPTRRQRHSTAAVTDCSSSIKHFYPLSPY